MGHAKVQHYVPRFLLAGFETTAGSQRVHVYDKHQSRAFLANVRSVAKEKGLYDIQLDGVTLTFEPALSEIEDRMAEVRARILGRGEIGFLNFAEREVVARFVLAQSMRTRQFLESVHAGGVALANALDKEHPGTTAALGFKADPEESRLVALGLLSRSAEWVPLLLEKAWGLYEAPMERPFWISDHPVAMHNNINKSDVRGTIGLAVPGIEIYLPISSRYCLGFICRSLRDMTDEAYRRSIRVKMSLDVELPTHEAVGALRDGLAYGFPIASNPDNVDYVNSMQVLYGERFVFSAHEDFAMIGEMIVGDSAVRRGPRPSVQ
jgi:hypothetical protein